MNAHKARRLRRQILALYVAVLAGNVAAVLRASTHHAAFRTASSAVVVATVVALIVAAHLRRELLASVHRTDARERP